MLLAPPEDDEVHPVLVCVVVLLETLLHDGVHVVQRADLVIHPFLLLRVRVHVVTEHERAHVLLLYLYRQ